MLVVNTLPYARLNRSIARQGNIVDESLTGRWTVECITMNFNDNQRFHRRIEQKKGNYPDHCLMRRVTATSFQATNGK